MKLHLYLKTYFRYTRSERAGIRVLMLIVIISFFFPYVVKSLSIKNNSPQNIVEKQAILANDSLKVRKDYKRATRKFTNQIIELNTADTTVLKQVRGIASWTASKIVAYRERLGGFYSIEQLNDLKLKGLSSDILYKQFRLDTSLVKTFDLDTISFKNLLRHPYFDYETVKKIFKLKNEYRGLSPEFLFEEKAIDTITYFKIRAYCVKK